MSHSSNEWCIRGCLRTAPSIRGRNMLFLKGCLDNADWEKIGEGTYQRLKEIDSYTELCKKLDVGVTPDQLHLRLGRAVLKAMPKHPRVYCEEITPERDYVSGFVITAYPDCLEITMHQLHHTSTTWTVLWRYFAPVVFAYYSSPSDLVYEDILNSLCHSATYSH